MSPCDSKLDAAIEVLYVDQIKTQPLDRMTLPDIAEMFRDPAALLVPDH